MGERQSICKKVFVTNEDTPTEHRKLSIAAETVDRLEFRVANGDTIVVKLSDFPEPIIAAAAWHGMSQKLGDRYAGKTADEVSDLLGGMIEQLKEGDWVTAAEGGGPRKSQLAEAFMRAMTEAGETVTLEQAVETVGGWDDDKKKSAAKVPQIEAALAEIRAEAALARVDKAKKAAAEAGNLADLLA